MSRVVQLRTEVDLEQWSNSFHGVQRARLSRDEREVVITVIPGPTFSVVNMSNALKCMLPSGFPVRLDVVYPRHRRLPTTSVFINNDISDAELRERLVRRRRA